MFTIYGHDGHIPFTYTLFTLKKEKETKFRSLFPLIVHMEFCFDWPRGYEERAF